MRSEVETNEKGKLSRGDLLKSWFTWICFGQIAYNYERMMGLGFTHSISNVLEKLYVNDEERLSEALTRHMMFYNTENTWGAIILGVVISLEEGRANGEPIDGETISGLKTALMGPIAGLGDSITQALVKVILLAIAVDFALQGSPVGVIIFILGFSLYALIVSYIMFNSGYRLGKNSIISLLSGGSLSSITQSLGAVGMTVLGALVAGNLNIVTPLSFTIGETTTEIQPMLDSILPNILNLGIFLFVYWLLLKKIKPNMIILILFGVAIVFSLLSIL